MPTMTNIQISTWPIWAQIPRKVGQKIFNVLGTTVSMLMNIINEIDLYITELLYFEDDCLLWLFDSILVL